MNKGTGRLTIYFEHHFWIGIFERVSEEGLSVCKVIFGVEPKDIEVYHFVLKNYDHLQFSSAIEVHDKVLARNPKRKIREIRKQIQNSSIGTKSQQALKLQQEQRKAQHKIVKGKQKEAEKQRRFERKQQKRKQKHRGR